MEPLFELVEDLSALTVDELRAAIESVQETVESIAGAPADYLVAGRDFAALKTELSGAVSWLATARAELASREESSDDDEDESDELAAEQQDELAALAEQARETAADDSEELAEDEPEAEAAETEEAEVETPAEVVAAAAPAKNKRLSKPARSRAHTPPVEEERIALTAAAEGLGYGLGQELPDADALSNMMIQRRKQFGHIAEGTHGDRVAIARADWTDKYPRERMLTSDDFGSNMEKIDAVTAPSVIRKNFVERRESDKALTASGGLCAPVTPYYQLMQLSTAMRPVRGALPTFNADRGGINAARPASLGAITTAVGTKTMDEDAAGGTTALKGCQVIDCPPFVETDIEIIYHCLQFGNVGARVFPELVTQWNQLVLAAHARTAETLLLDGIHDASTHVTATDLGLGATSNYPSQILAAADGLRSRHRISPDTVLRLMAPYWVLDLLCSDMYRTQFDRFDMTPQDFIRVLRMANVEPTFYMDSPTGKGQVFGPQSASALLSFPSTVVSYLYPEGSFLYLDGGTLELGLVRDSILNSTNDWQIFGESFENVAFIGIESIELTSTLCDSGAVSLPVDVTECGDYGVS